MDLEEIMTRLVLVGCMGLAFVGGLMFGGLGSEGAEYDAGYDDGYADALRRCGAAAAPAPAGDPGDTRHD